MSDVRPVLLLCNEYCAVLDAINGAFLDATVGLGAVARHYIGAHEAFLRERASKGELKSSKDLNPTFAYLGTVDDAQGCFTTRLSPT